MPLFRLKGDLHMHSTFSDGRNSPEEILLAAVEKDLDVISITDHDTFSGALRALKAAKSMQLDLVVIVGAEVRTTAGDILVYCSDSLPDTVPRDPFELADVAHGHGCIVVPAHPFDARRKGIGKLVYDGQWDAIEVYNAHSDPFSNHRAEQAARELGLPGIANSDAHVASAVGSAYNIIEADDRNADSIIDAIKTGRVKPVYGRPSFSAIASTLAWSIERRIKKRHGPSRLDYMDCEDYGACMF